MSSPNSYDVTAWPHGNPYEDLGEVINSIIADVKDRQGEGGVKNGGKPGAVIYLPPGDYRLRTQVRIDVSFLKIEGSGHGFTSSSIRFNVAPEEWADLHELWPGGSRVMVDLPIVEGAQERDGAAFVVEREGSPRISSVEFSNFCIDGLHFEPDGESKNPENSYINGKTGIYVVSANDSFKITGMGFVYLEHALTMYNADALSIHDNFIAECGNCIELRGWGQASKVTDNLIGAGSKGYSIFAENHGGLLVSSNNIFPRGASSVTLEGVNRSSVTNNRLHSFYPGMVVVAGGSSENLIASNHFLRDHEPWAPFLGVDNGLDDDFGLLRIEGDHNSVLANHFSEVVDPQLVRPLGGAPVIVRVHTGVGNRVANNHIVALKTNSNVSDSCFEAQVDALLTSSELQDLVIKAVVVGAGASRNVVLDSGTEDQISADRSMNVVRAIPAFGQTAAS